MYTYTYTYTCVDSTYGLYLAIDDALPLYFDAATAASSSLLLGGELTSLALMAMSDACPLAMLRGWWSMMLALGSAERCPGSPDARSIAPSPNACVYRIHG